MKTLLKIIFFFCFSIQIISVYSQTLKGTPNSAINNGFPVLQGVSGFGLDAIGGRGGKVIVVNNLNKEGEGSLAEAIGFDFPRIIVFEVAGVIDLEKKGLRIRNPYVTIAGQTAPSPGITLIKGGIGITTHDVIIQHIKVRPGKAGESLSGTWSTDAISTGGGAWNVIIDHVSATWASDETISASGPRFEGSNPDEWRKNTSHKVTISNCIIAQSLNRNLSDKFHPSKGTLIHDNASEILVYGNLFANNVDRNPLCKGGTETAIVNNFVFNPGTSVIHYALVPTQWEGHAIVTGKLTVEGNLIEYGPNTSEKITPGLFSGPVEVYWKDNMVIEALKKEVGAPDNPNLVGLKMNEMLFAKSRPVWPDGLVTLPATEVKNYVLKNAGAFPWDRDEIDKKIIEGVKAGIGQYIETEDEVDGYPEVKPVYRKFNPDEWDLDKMTIKTNLAAKILP